MPSTLPLPFRLRTLSVSAPPSYSEDESEDSSPEHDMPRAFHFPAAKRAHKSAERLMNIPDAAKIPRGAPENLFEGAHISLTFRNTPVAERTANPYHKSVVASDPAPTKQTLIRRVTSKLRISIPLKSPPDALRSRPSTRTLPANTPAQRPRPPRAQKPVSSNSLVSREHREAALRERGLLPPRKDFSQQEREADRRLGHMPSPTSMTFNGSTEAEQFKATWLAMNRTSESSESDCPPPATPQEQGPPPTPFSAPDAVSRKSSESRTDVPYAGRPSFSSSLPPLSACHLEVLHEDPSEHGPITPPLSPANPPIIVSSPTEYPPSHMIVESPTSCTFSSNFPGSTVESQSQSDHPPPVPKKDNLRCRRTVDSDDRSRKLSRLGTRSLTNLRRSVTDSLKRQSMSTLPSADHPSFMIQAPRMATSPTIHSMASILRETRDIEDDESRRLSELAFLD